MERRDFLKKAALAVTGVSISNSLLAKESGTRFNNLDVRAIKSVWESKGLPQVSLYVHENKLLSAENEIRGKIKLDFQQDKVLFVDGLVLSESESALLIYLNS